MRPRRHIRATLVASVVLAAVFAAACGSDDDGARRGCRPRAIAYIGPLTGVDAGFVRNARDAAELAVRRYNDEHAACPVGLIGFDTTKAGDEPSRIVAQIVADSQILGVVGPTFSGEAAAVMPALEKAGLSEVTGSATNPGLADNGWRTFHRIVGTDAAVAPADVAFIADRLEARRVAVVDDSGLYGRTLGDLAAEGLRERTIEVPVRASIDPESVAYRDDVNSVIAADVDTVFFGGLSTPGARFIRQLRDAGYTGNFVGGDGIYQDEFITSAGKAAIGAYGSCPCVDSSGGSPAQIGFAQNFLRTYGTTPGAYAAEYFDATNLFLEAFAAGATTRKTVLEQVSAADTPGLTKRIRFDARGDVEGGPIYIYRVAPPGRFVRAATVVDGKLLDD